ncbi:endonuclease III domain-containing protein [Flavobacterium terrigena]|uniref:Endonuclease-3 n=1 Tax=Flavobacterium terrigena TaxID=402734 RepID=A0A1H6XJN8_9FLAO|nr:DNA lyase [Flavobacterium terrigena]SEJ29321.1 endonuclease-3 [Flavobacterium terrigena]
MDLFTPPKDWKTILQPIIETYKGRKHPLEYSNLYELMVAVLLSAQDSDAHINKIMPIFIEKYPSLEAINSSNLDSLENIISKVMNSKNKASWLFDIAKNLEKDENIPLTLHNLIQLKGIGRKSANVILREMNQPAEGIIADLHVIRVAPRIGLTDEIKDGIKIEKQLMTVLPKEIWNEIGMALSFLGREICRPSNPKCLICFLKNDCNYFKNT